MIWVVGFLCAMFGFILGGAIGFNAGASQCGALKEFKDMKGERLRGIIE